MSRTATCRLLRIAFMLLVLGSASWRSRLATADEPAAASAERPNILFAIADDWSWPHAGAYGDPVVKTPTFDRLAEEGALFHHAYVSAPSCTPSRGAVLTGQWHWRLEGAANLWSVFPDKFATYPELLEEAGYEVGVTGKGWGPGRTETEGRALAGRRSKNFQHFLDRRDPDYAEVKRKLADRLMAELRASGDPRALGGGDRFDQYPYLGGAPKHPDAR